MTDRAEVLHRVALFLKRIITGGETFDGNLESVELERLASSGRQDQLALDNEGRANRNMTDLFEIIDLGRLVYNLQGVKTGSVMKNDETQRF